MKFLIKSTYTLMAVVIFLYMIYFAYSVFSGTDPLAPQVQFIVNIATLLGILAVLEDRREKRKNNG